MMDAMLLGLLLGQVVTIILFVTSEILGMSDAEYNSLVQILAPMMKKLAMGLVKKPEDKEADKPLEYIGAAGREMSS